MVEWSKDRSIWKPIYSKPIQKSMIEFLSFIGKSAQTIEKEFSSCETLKDERNFKKQYTDAVNGYIAHLQSRGMTRNSQSTAIGVVKSFFKYRDLPLNFDILKVSTEIQYPDRDITKEELLQVLEASKPRERAFYSIIAQSGLRPDSVCGLHLKDIEPDFSRGVVPCCIKVSKNNTKGAYGSYITFMGEKSIQSLKTYILAERPNIQLNDLIFAQNGAEKLVKDKNHHDQKIASNRKGLPASPASFGRLFNLTLRKLLRTEQIKFEVRFNKPGELKLYSLRKYFRNHAGNENSDYINYWMGHLSALGTDLHYLSRGIEEHRKVYAEKAMPFLTLESPLEVIAIGKMDKKLQEVEESRALLEDKVIGLMTEVQSLQRVVNFQSKKLDDNKALSESEVKSNTLDLLLTQYNISVEDIVHAVADRKQVVIPADARSSRNRYSTK